MKIKFVLHTVKKFKKPFYVAPVFITVPFRPQIQTSERWTEMNVLFPPWPPNVSQMFHCEAAELFVVLSDMPCFPSRAFWHWWAYNQYGHRKSLSAFAVWQSVLVWWWKGFTRHFTLLKKKLIAPIVHLQRQLCWVWTVSQENHTRYFTLIFPLSCWVRCQYDWLRSIVCSGAVHCSPWGRDGFVLSE